MSGAWTTGPARRQVTRFPDTELELTTLLRPVLQGAGHDVLVSNRQLATKHRYAVLVRDDGGAETLATTVRRVGIRVLGPSDDWVTTAALAHDVSAAVRALPGTGAVVDARIQLSPVRVTDGSDLRPELYMTAEVTLTGTSVPVNAQP